MKNQCSTNNKTLLRTSTKERRNKLNNDFVETQSLKICDTIYEKTKKFDVFLCYLGFKNEVNLNSLIKKLFYDNKTVCVPVCVDDENMIVSQIDNIEFDFQKNKFGILEPKKIKNPNCNVQVCITPGVCFDLNKNRIGHGKGYYDRFFMNNNVYKIGVCYDFQLVDEIPASSHDIKMDCIITEKRVF